MNMPPPNMPPPQHGAGQHGSPAQQPGGYGPPPIAGHAVAPPGYGPPPAQPMQPPQLTVGDHVKRALTWRLERVTPSPQEVNELGAAHVTDAALQGYSVWRRSVLLVVLPVVALSAVLAIVGFKDVTSEQPIDATGTVMLEYTGLGVIAQVLPLLGPPVLALGVFLAFRSWASLRRSSRLLTVCWLASILLPVLPAVLPADWLINDEPLRQLFVSQEVDAFLAGLRVQVGIGYMVTLLPVLVTVPGGVVRGSARVKGLLPATTLPGFFLITTAPFYSLIVIVALVLLIQLSGNVLLVLGALALAGSPWVYVQQRRHYLGPVMDDESSAALDSAQRIYGALTLAGVGAIVLWAFTAKVNGVAVLGSGDEAVFDYVTAARSMAEVLARSYATTVVFAHIFLTLTMASWRTARAVASDPRMTAAEHRNAAVAAALDE